MKAANRPPNIEPVTNISKAKHALGEADEAGNHIAVEAICRSLMLVDKNNIQYLEKLIFSLIHQDKISADFFPLLGAAITLTVTESKFYHIAALTIYNATKDINVALSYMCFACSLDPSNQQYQLELDELLKHTGKAKVKLIFLPDWKIGHLVSEVDIWHRFEQLYPRESTHFIFIQSDGACNSALISIYRRRLNVVSECPLLHKHFRTYPDILERRFIEELPFNSVEKFGNENWRSDESIWHLLDKIINDTESVIDFSREENEKGMDCLRIMGIDPVKDKFICMHSRGQEYHEKTFANSNIYSSTNWSFSNCRNMEFSIYTQAIDYLIEQGYYVIRLGKVVGKPVGYKHPKFVDYSSDYREQMDGDFMDIFLSIKCHFFIGNCTGLTHFPMHTGEPTLIVNSVPGLPSSCGRIGMYVPKLIRKQGTDDFLEYSKMFDLSENKHGPMRDNIAFLVNSEEMAKRGFEFIDNTAEEILEAVKEMHLYVKNGFIELNEQDMQLEKEFLSVFPKGHFFSECRRKISTYFLRKHSKVLCS